MKRQFGYHDSKLKKWCGEDKFIINWRGHLKNICKCDSNDDKQLYISNLFHNQKEYFIRFEKGPDDDLQYVLTDEELLAFADKSRCSPLTKRRESNYDNYDFLDFFKSIRDSFLNDMRENNYYFFDSEDMKYLRTIDGDSTRDGNQASEDVEDANGCTVVETSFDVDANNTDNIDDEVEDDVDADADA